jgi:hypothetical protein
MKYGIKVSLIAATIAAVGIGGTLVAYADWPIPGTGSIAWRTAKIPRGVTPSVAKVEKKAVVSWSAQEIADGVKMKSYVVTAHSVEDPLRQAVTHVVTASGATTESVTFAANEVAGGKWYWTLIPKYGSWAGEESRKSDKLNFPAPAAPTALVANPASADAAPAGAAKPDATTPAAGTPEATKTESSKDPEPSSGPVDSEGPPASADPSPSESSSASAPGGSTGEGAGSGGAGAGSGGEGAASDGQGAGSGGQGASAPAEAGDE